MAEDFLHVLKLVDKERRERYKDCDVICLGTYLKNFNFPRNNKMVSGCDTLPATFPDTPARERESLNRDSTTYTANDDAVMRGTFFPAHT